MYKINKRRRNNYKIIIILFVYIPLVGLLAGGVWFLVLKSNKTTTSNFTQANGQVATIAEATQLFSTESFSISLPSTWVFIGKLQPAADQTYYKYQDKNPKYSNRLLEIYVDNYPTNFSFNRVLPVQIENNKLVPSDNVSDDCSSFNGMPVNAVAAGQWIASWQGVSFNCSVNQPRNYVAAATVSNGVGIPLYGSKSGTHRYVFVYIDQNSAPNYTLFGPFLKTFQPI